MRDSYFLPIKDLINFNIKNNCFNSANRLKKRFLRIYIPKLTLFDQLYENNQLNLCRN
jgi:hypothetical protein